MARGTASWAMLAASALLLMSVGPVRSFSPMGVGLASVSSTRSVLRPGDTGPAGAGSRVRLQAAQPRVRRGAAGILHMAKASPEALSDIVVVSQIFIR